MDDAIKAGDLVMVVRGHECFYRAKGGVPFTVLAIVPQQGGGWRCPKCREQNLAPSDLFGAKAGWRADGAVPISWLKKIPPLGELGDVPKREEIEA